MMKWVGRTQLKSEQKNMGNPYTVKEKWIDRTLFKSEICIIYNYYKLL